MKKLNSLFDVDSYKASQYAQYPENTTKVYSYFESRLGEGFKKLVFFGLQYTIKNIINQQITHADIDFAKKFFNAHMGCFNEAGWRYIVDTHNGYLPIQIQAVPEGTVLSRGNVLFTIESTDSNVAWLPQYVETILVRSWSTINVATLSYHLKLKLLAAFEETSDAPGKEAVLFKLHDFGSRGAYSQEAAAIGGMGHLVNFLGSDTIAAVLCGQDTYNTDEMLAYSIPAMEHSTVTSWGRNGEKDAFTNMINTYGGKAPFLAMVVDSYDMENAVKNIIGKELNELVRKCGSTVVVRPDSGEPKDSVLSCLQWLEEGYGVTVNSKGYKVLPDCIRVIQGDGITYESLTGIVDHIKNAGYAIDNLAFGMGGGLLQKHDRDTLRFAQKCSYIEIDDVGRDVQKMPKTDPTKASKKGRLKLVKDGDDYKTIADDKFDGQKNELVVVYYHNAKFGHKVPLVKEWSFQEIRARTGTW